MNNSKNLTLPPKINQLHEINGSLFRDEFEKSVKGFNRLPEEILLKIFTHLNVKDLQNAQQVCQRWRQGALNPSLWKNLKIQGLHTTESVNVAMKKIFMFGQLEQVYIKDVLEVSALLRQIYRCLPNLQHLIIRYCDNLSSQTMKGVLRKCQQLKLLDLKGTTFKDTVFYEDLPRLENLKVLNLSDNRSLTTKDMIDISLNCRNLEEFYVSLIKTDTKNKQLTDGDCTFIVSNMSKNLKGFSIDGATLTDLCFQRILLCDKLEHFGFHRAYNLNGQTFSVIWKYLKHLTTLKLTFANQVGGKDIETLFRDGKQEMSHLEIIDFSGCWKITDEGIEAISESCPKLKKLIIKCCKNITNISCLKKCRNLEILNIAFCFRLLMASWLPIQDSIQMIFVDQSEHLHEIEENLKKENRNIKIHVCHSQYKKSFENYDISISNK